MAKTTSTTGMLTGNSSATPVSKELKKARNVVSRRQEKLNVALEGGDKELIAFRRQKLEEAKEELRRVEKSEGPTKQPPIQPEPTKCPEGFYYSEKTKQCEPLKQAPEPTPEPEPEEEDRPDDSEEMTFTFIEGRERDGAHADYLFQQQGEVQQVTVDELRAYFNDPKKTNRLPEVFGTFDNYLAYMTEREELIQSGAYTLGDWVSADPDLSQEQLDILRGEDVYRDFNDETMTREYLDRQIDRARYNAYVNWINSEVNQALLEKYGVPSTVYSDTGDQFQWNGSAYVKTYDQGHNDVDAFFQIASNIFVSAALGNVSGVGNAVSTALNLSGSTATAIAAGIDAAVGQAGSSIARGESVDLDLRSIIASAITAGFIDSGVGNELLSQIPESGISALDEAIQAGVVNSATQLLLSGEIDLETLGQAMLRAGLSDQFDSLIDQIEEAAGLQGEAFENFLRDLQEQFPDIDPGVLEDAIRDLTDVLPTEQVEEVLGSIVDRTGQAWDDFTNYLETEGYTIEDFDLFESVLETIGQAIPTSVSDLQDLFESIIEGMNPFSYGCEEGQPNNGGETGGWTGTSSRRVGDESAVVVGTDQGQSAYDYYPGWMDCVNLSVLIGIPGLDVPLPPGLTDFSVADLRAAVVDAGDSFDDFLDDPGAWLEGKIDDIIEGITEPFADDAALQDYLGTILGGAIAGALYDQIKGEIENEVPDLFLPFAPEEEGNECTIEGGEGEQPTRGRVQGGQCVPLTQEEIDQIDAPMGRCEDGTPYADEEGTNCEEYAPPFENTGPTVDECAALNRAHIPANPETGENSKCSGCAKGFEPVANEEGETVCQPIDEIQGPCKGKQLRNELTGGCEDPPPAFEEGAPCKDDNGVDGTYDEEGNCIASPLEPEFGYCEDGKIAKQDKRGSNCPENIKQPPEVIEGPTEEECQSQGRMHIAGDPKRGIPSECGELIRQAPEVIEPETGVVDDGGVEITPEFGMCPDNKTPKTDAKGTNCPPVTVVTNPCENPDYAQVNEEECREFLIPGGDPDTGPDTGPEPDPGMGEGPEKCPEGFYYSEITKGCEPLRLSPEPEPEPPVVTCNDPNATVAEDGSCGPCKDGFTIDIQSGLCLADVTEDTCPNGARDYPLCSECEDGSRPNDHEEGECSGPLLPVPSPEPEPEPEPQPEPQPEPEPGGGGGGGGGGGRSGMLSADLGWSRQPFTAVEYRAPTRAIDVLNNFIETEVKQSLIQNSTQNKGMFDV